MYEELIKRRKGQHLSKESSKYIARILDHHFMDCKLIKKYYKLSRLTMKRVKLLYSPNNSNNVEEKQYIDRYNDQVKKQKNL